MRFSVLERLILLNLLPKEGTYANLKQLRVVRERLAFTDAENKSLAFRTVGTDTATRTVWNNEALVVKATGRAPELTGEDLTKAMAANPEDYEMRPVCPDKEIFTGEVIDAMVTKALMGLEEQAALQEEHISLYEKFVLTAAKADKLNLVDPVNGET